MKPKTDAKSALAGVAARLTRAVGPRTASVGLLTAALAGTLAGSAGCAVHATYAEPTYYYRTRVAYTAYGPVYVRERVYVAPVREEVVYTPPPPAPVPAPAPAPAAPAESPAAAELHPLVAPIALYPDPLIAVILPAATFPQQVQDANAWVAANPSPQQADIDAQPWDASVKALVHYPTVLAKLAGDAQWTESLGSAFTNQPADVMASIQEMRAQAAAAGSLVDTPQQVVVREEGVIAIQPANPEVIFVPEYDPVVVYVGYHPLVFAEVSYATGPWFVTGCYWTGGVILVGDWHCGYYYREGHWGRDVAFRVDVRAHWVREARFGPPPHIARAHYVVPRAVHGHEAELHRAMAQRAAERREIQHREAQRPVAPRPAQAARPTPAAPAARRPAPYVTEQHPVAQRELRPARESKGASGSKNGVANAGN